MRILALDTSTMLGSVALTEDKRLVAEEQLGVAVTHSERLLSTIEHLLDTSGWKISDLDGVAVSIGPGSFTGLRIGLATAKGIAFGLKKPIVGISSLLVLAYNGFLSQNAVAAVMDARRKQVYAAVYKFRNDKSCAFKSDVIVEETVLDPVDFAKKLKKIPGKILMIGDGVLTYEKEFRAHLKNKILIPTGNMMYPHASHLAFLAQSVIKKGSKGEMTDPAPNYLRRSDAEIGFNVANPAKRIIKRKARR